MTDDKVLMQDEINNELGQSAKNVGPAEPIAPPKLAPGQIADAFKAKTVTLKPEQPENKPLTSCLSQAGLALSGPIHKPRLVQTNPELQNNEAEVLRATIAELTRRLDRIESAVIRSQKSFRCDVKNVFLCNTCKSHGKVAMYLKCTSCGKEQWMGWR
jgi:hypothetical protein